MNDSTTAAPAPEDDADDHRGTGDFVVAPQDFVYIVARINSLRDAQATTDEIRENVAHYVESNPTDPEARSLKAASSSLRGAIDALIAGSRESYYDKRPAVKAAIEAELSKILDPRGSAAGVGDLEDLTRQLSPRRLQRVPPPPFVPFPIDALPEPVAAFVVAHANAIGCDPSMVAVPLLAVLGAAIGTSRRMRLKQGWSEPPIVWTGIVSPSGELKSAGFDAAVEPLQKVQDEAVQDHLRERGQWAIAKQVHEAALQEWKRKNNPAVDPPAPPAEPTCQRFIVKDSTTEAIAPILRDNPRGVLLGRDELAGWLRSFDAYKGGRGGDVATWLELFRGRPTTIDRKHGAEKFIHVPFASVSICGTIQPGALKAALGQEHFANGLAARLLVAMPPRRPRVWSDAEVDPAMVAPMDRLVRQLLALEQENGQPVDVGMSPDGKAAYIEFFNLHGQQLESFSGDLAAAWSKLEGYCARFSLILHEVRVAAGDTSAGDAVDARDVGAAKRLVEWFGREAERVYAVLAETADETEHRDLIDLIHRRGGSITISDLARSGPRRFRNNAAAAGDALQRLASDGVGEWVSAPSGENGGRPTRALRLHRVDTDMKPFASPDGPGEVDTNPPTAPDGG